MNDDTNQRVINKMSTRETVIIIKNIASTGNTLLTRMKLWSYNIARAVLVQMRSVS